MKETSLKATAHFLKNPKTKPVLHAVERLCRTTARSLNMLQFIQTEINLEPCTTWGQKQLSQNKIMWTTYQFYPNRRTPWTSWQLHSLCHYSAHPLCCSVNPEYHQRWLKNEQKKKMNSLLWLNRVLLWMPQGFLREEPWNGDKRSTKWWRERK